MHCFDKLCYLVLHVSNNLISNIEPVIFCSQLSLSGIRITEDRRFLVT